MAGEFEAFTEETTGFLAELRDNNDRAWFAEHRDAYEAHLLDVSRAFVTALGEELSAFAPRIVADPRVNRSIFRLARDTRFSSDPTPYKTHLACIFWEGEGKRMEEPSFYFELGPEHLFIAAGLYRFPRAALPTWRELVVNRRQGPKLARIVAALREADLEVGGEQYVRTPRGCPKAHARDGLLRHKGIYVGERFPTQPDALFDPERCLPWLAERYEVMLPLHAWLVEMRRRMA